MIDYPFLNGNRTGLVYWRRGTFYFQDDLPQQAPVPFLQPLLVKVVNAEGWGPADNDDDVNHEE